MCLKILISKKSEHISNNSRISPSVVFAMFKYTHKKKKLDRVSGDL